MPKFITADEFKARPLGIAIKQIDPVALAAMIEVASENVEDYLERSLLIQSYTATFTGDGSDTYIAWNYPITQITSLTQTDSLGAQTTMDVAKIDITRSYAGILRLSGTDAITSFGPSSTYTLTYSAGIAATVNDLPARVKHATALWTAELLRPDYAGAGDDASGIALSSEQIVELIGKLRRKRIGG